MTNASGVPRLLGQAYMQSVAAPVSVSGPHRSPRPRLETPQLLLPSAPMILVGQSSRQSPGRARPSRSPSPMTSRTDVSMQSFTPSRHNSVPRLVGNSSTVTLTLGRNPSAPQELSSMTMSAACSPSTPIAPSLPAPPPFPVPNPAVSRCERAVTEVERELSRRSSNAFSMDGPLIEDGRIAWDKYPEKIMRRRDLERGRLSALEADHMAIRHQLGEIERRRIAVESKQHDVSRSKRSLEGTYDGPTESIDELGQHVGSPPVADHIAIRHHLSEIERRQSSVESRQHDVQSYAETEKCRSARLEKDSSTARLAVEADLNSMKSTFSELQTKYQNMNTRVRTLEAEAEELRRALNERSVELAMVREENQNLKLRQGLQASQLVVSETDSVEDSRIIKESTDILKLKRFPGICKAGFGQQFVAAQGVDGSCPCCGSMAHDRPEETNRIKVLESQLADAEDRLGKLQELKATSVLEERLVEAQTSREKCLQERVLHMDRINELVAEVEELRSDENKHVRKHGVLTQQVSELEAEIAHLNDMHGQKQKRMSNRITQLERDAEETCDPNEVLKLRMRVVELEKQVEERDGQLNESQQVLQFMEISAQWGGSEDDFNQRISTMIQEMAVQRDALVTAKVQVEAVAEELLGEADRALHRIKKKSKSAEKKEARFSNQDSIRSNRFTNQDSVRSNRRRSSGGMVDSISRAISSNSISNLSNAGLELRRISSLVSRTGSEKLQPSLVARQASEKLQCRSPAFSRASSERGDSPFRRKIRQANASAANLSRVVAELRCRGIGVQIEKLKELRRDGDAADSSATFLTDHLCNNEMDAECQNAAEQVEIMVRDLRALREELRGQSDLPAADKDPLGQGLALHIEALHEDLSWLQCAVILEGVPENVLQMLVDFSAQGPSVVWPGGSSPMHWAAQNGRKDVALYLLSLPDGRSLLQAVDDEGYTPLHYAENLPDADIFF